MKGRRIEKNVNGTITKYLYDGDALLAEYNGANELQRNYFYGSGDINSSILFESSTVYFYHHDHLNTPQAVTNEGGTIVWDATYKAFGETTITTGTVTNNLRFPGQYYDAESGLHYNYHRYYEPNTGRYLREDPLRLSDFIIHNIDGKINYCHNCKKDIGIYWSKSYRRNTTIIEGLKENNPYVYSINNPLNFIDSLGLYVYNYMCIKSYLSNVWACFRNELCPDETVYIGLYNIYNVPCFLMCILTPEQWNSGRFNDPAVK